MPHAKTLEGRKHAGSNLIVAGSHMQPISATEVQDATGEMASQILLQALEGLFQSMEENGFPPEHENGRLVLSMEIHLVYLDFVEADPLIDEVTESVKQAGEPSAPPAPTKGVKNGTPKIH